MIAVLENTVHIYWLPPFFMPQYVVMPTKRSAASAVHISAMTISEALATYIFGALIDQQLKNQMSSVGK